MERLDLLGRALVIRLDEPLGAIQEERSILRGRHFEELIQRLFEVIARQGSIERGLQGLRRLGIEPQFRPQSTQEPPLGVGKSPVDPREGSEHPHESRLDGWRSRHALIRLFVRIASPPAPDGLVTNFGKSGSHIPRSQR